MVQSHFKPSHQNRWNVALHAYTFRAYAPTTASTRTKTSPFASAAFPPLLRKCVCGPAGAFDRDVINFSATRDNIGKYLCEDMDNGLTKEIRVRLIGDNEETEDAEIETESSATTANLTVMLVMI